MKIVVLDAETLGLERSAWSALEKLGELVCWEHTPHGDRECIVERLRGAEVVLSNKVPLGRAELECLPELRLISVLATGVNNVDLAAARDCGVTVCNVAGYSTASTAQHAVALLLELVNGVGLHNASVQAGEWIRSRQFCYWKRPVREVAGLTVGIAGFGAIGRRVGEIVHSLGAGVVALQRQPRNPPAYEPFSFAKDLRDLVERSDVVSLHCPLTPETERMVNADLLDRMRPDALLINTARGGLVDEEALAAALREGRLAGAALDVVDGEPMRSGHPLLGVPNCVITPHIAWAGEASRRRLLARTVENLRAWLAGQPMNVVQVE